MSDPGPTVPDPEPTASAAPAAERPSRGRSAAVVICLLLAALLTTPAGIAYWGQRTLNDTCHELLSHPGFFPAGTCCQSTTARAYARCRDTRQLYRHDHLRLCHC